MVVAVGEVKDGIHGGYDAVGHGVSGSHGTAQGDDRRGKEAAAAVGAAELCRFNRFFCLVADVAQADADDCQSGGRIGLFYGGCGLGVVAEGDVYLFRLFHDFFFGEDHELLAVIGHDQACCLAFVFIGVVQPIHIGNNAGYGDHGFGAVLGQLVEVAVQLLVIGHAHIHLLDNGGGDGRGFLFFFGFSFQNHVLGKHFFIFRFLLELHGGGFLLGVQPVAENRLQHKKSKACDKAEDHCHGGGDHGSFQQLSLVDGAFLYFFLDKINVPAGGPGGRLRQV